MDLFKTILVVALLAIGANRFAEQLYPLLTCDDSNSIQDIEVAQNAITGTCVT